MTDDVMVVPDATLDPRFQNNPFVAGKASVRFYAGAPISFRDGLRVGSVCLIDRHPRQFRESERKVLQDLAQIVNGLLSVHASEQRAKHHSDTSEGQKVLLRQQQRDLWRQNKMLIQTERMAQIGGWEWSVERDVLTMSDEIYHLMEIPPGTHLNRDSILAIYDQPGRQKLEQAVEDALASGASFDMELPFTTTSGQVRWAHVLGEVERWAVKSPGFSGSFRTSRHAGRPTGKSGTWPITIP
jgi:hypothetical protein